MTPAKFAALVRIYTGTDAVTFTDAEILAFANPYKDEIASQIVLRNEDYFGMLFTRDLVAGRREYALPDEILNSIKYTEAKLDGTNLSRLDEFDLNSYKRPTSEADIIAQFSSLSPKFDIFRRSLWIYSGTAIIDVVAGLKLWAIIYPADITDLSSTTDMSVDPSTTSHGFPRQFHELLARRVSIGYKSSLDKPRKLSPMEALYNVDIERALNAITGGNQDRSVIATTPYNDGQQY